MLASFARDIGLESLSKYDGIEHLIEATQRQVFPLQSEEASELFRVGQQEDGPLSRQSDETMLSYMNRRKRWWVTLRELDPSLSISEPMRANLLVELGLRKSEQLMVKTAADFLAGLGPEAGKPKIVLRSNRPLRSSKTLNP